MLAEAVRTLHSYGIWANQRILNAATRLSQPQFTARSEGGYGSIRDTLVHIAASDWLFLERWQGRSPTELRDPSEFPDITAVRARMDEVDAAKGGFIANLTEADLCRDVSYLNFQGETWSYPLWQQVLHTSNHGTQHRSEIGAQVTQLGESPGWLDFLVYIDEQGNSTE